MANNRKRRLARAVREADQRTLVGLLAIEGYQPTNSEQSPEVLAKTASAVEAARVADINAANTHKAARRALVDVEWQLHDILLGARLQVRAQYGGDADEVTAVGLKRSSQRKPTAKRPAPRETGES